MSNGPTDVPRGFIAGVVRIFLTSNLSIVFIIFALSLGAVAIFATPREEEPQIVVPFADVFVRYPGASAEEVEKLVATPLERLLWQISGVEHVYSVSRPDLAIVTVRFYVGEDRERSLVKLHNKISMNIDQVPPGIQGWVIKPVEIDDVPIVNITVYSERYDDFQLRSIGEEILARLDQIENISRTTLVGGRQREVRVELDIERMLGFGVSPSEVLQALQGADASIAAGTISNMNSNIVVAGNAFIASAEDVEGLMVTARHGRPVYLRDMATILDGPEEFWNHTRIGFPDGTIFPAVTLALAKKEGTNAVVVAKDILKTIKDLKRDIIPSDVRFEITRDYGKTANEKVDDLLASLFFAIATVVLLIAITMGWREAVVVALAVPISFAMALFVNYLFGYTINRVTLFALILSLGLVVDDPITNVDNIQRHILLKRTDPLSATLYAVNEVLPPIIMSTLAIIVSFVPMFFITGMMGPYMAPMAINVPLTVTFSTISAVTVVPWLTHRLLRRSMERHGEAIGRDVTPVWVRHGYRRLISPLLESRKKTILLLIGLFFLLLLSVSLVLFRAVPLKMLPFDNKNEFQIVIDMPEDATLERTDSVVRAFESYLQKVPEVTNFVSYVGTSSPMDFNGMVRQYYLRNRANMADIRINMVGKKYRKQQSHEIMLRIRKDLEDIAQNTHANIKIVEVPPGPPVLATVVAEVYGDPDVSYGDIIEGASEIKKLLHEEPFVVDVDDTVALPWQKADFVVDKEKAALHGIATREILHAIQLAVSGNTPASVHIPNQRQPILIRVVLPEKTRSSLTKLSRLAVKAPSGHMVELGELGEFAIVTQDQPIYHKNLERVVFVTADTAGRPPAEAILDMQSKLQERPASKRIRIEWAGEGEWEITLRVFRDLAIAFGAAVLGIYILLIIQTGSFSMPFVIMMAIPLTIIGIMPGFWLLNVFKAQSIGGFENPVFFTATSMIGMIALGGIVTRNAIVLIEFIQEAVRRKSSLKEAIVQSGAVRMRPILLTAATTGLGAWPITLDPIFSGLAWALIFGLFASTAFTLIVVPVAYYLIYDRKEIAMDEKPS